MRKYLPVIEENGNWGVMCPLDGKFSKLSHGHGIKKSCIPSGSCDHDSTCEYHKGIDHNREKVKESIRDYVMICDIPKEKLMVKMFRGEKN